MTWDRSRTNVVILAACLAFGMSGNTLMVTSAAVIGYSLFDDKSLATLPVATFFIGLMATTMPGSLLMKRIGRRPGFMIGALIGMAGSGVAMLGIWRQDVVLFCLGTMLIGSANAFTQYYRFAAADTASDDFRPIAVSLVMCGGVFAALIGPNLAAGLKDVFPLTPFLGSFLGLAALQAVIILLLAFIDIPRPSGTERTESGRPWGELLRQPRLVIAMLGAMLGYSVMTFVMTATPLAVIGCGYVFSDAAMVIQWHVIGMFGPAFFTGKLIKQFGARQVMLTGGLLYLGTIGFALTGLDLALNFWPALVLLGIGWNFLFIGGTAMLTSCYAPEEKAKVQGLNDLLVSICVTLASLTSGVIYAQFGWPGVMAGAAPIVAAILVALLWLTVIERRAEPAAAE